MQVAHKQERKNAYLSLQRPYPTIITLYNIGYLKYLPLPHITKINNPQAYAGGSSFNVFYSRLVSYSYRSSEAIHRFAVLRRGHRGQDSNHQPRYQ